MRAYVDSDVLIWHLRGEKKALSVLQGLRARPEVELWTGAMQRAEVVFLMRPDEERATLELMAQFETHAVDRSVVDLAGELYRQFNPSHGIDVNDAMLAAMALQTSGTIYTLNVKHYPMPSLLVQRAWD